MPSAASIMALATPAVHIPGGRAYGPEDMGVWDSPCHAEWPHVADAVSKAAGYTGTVPFTVTRYMSRRWGNA